MALSSGGALAPKAEAFGRARPVPHAGDRRLTDLEAV